MTAYDLARGGADGWLAPTHFLPQADVDAWLFGGTAPDRVARKQHLHDPGRVRWFEVAAFLVYVSHFFVTPLLAAVAVGARPLALPPLRRLARAADAARLRHVRRLPGGAAVDGERARADRADHATDPAAVDVDRRRRRATGLVGTGYRYANDVAAVPSLHAALRAARGAERLAAALVGARCSSAAYPLAMAFAIVYTGEHYVADVLLGWLYAVASFAAIRWIAAPP